MCEKNVYLLLGLKLYDDFMHQLLFNFLDNIHIYHQEFNSNFDFIEYKIVLNPNSYTLYVHKYTDTSTDTVKVYANLNLVWSSAQKAFTNH